MTTTPRPSREIDGKGRTVRELLADRYYQREYKWRQKQLAERIWNPERLAQEAAS